MVTDLGDVGQVYYFQRGDTIAAPKTFLPDCANLHIVHIYPRFQMARFKCHTFKACKKSNLISSELEGVTGNKRNAVKGYNRRLDLYL
jgi:hypothetical protein